VTQLAIGRESGLKVIGIGRGRKRLGMTSLAVHRRSPKIAAGRRSVAGFAVRRRMNACQRKTPLHVQFQNILLILPIARCVAILAIESQLTLMMIGMAIRACGAHAIEHKILVAAAARRLPVTTHQREPGLRMVESQRRTQRRPALGCMTVFAVVLKSAMRVSRARFAHEHAGAHDQPKSENQ
jgi:hypothetical protein